MQKKITIDNNKFLISLISSIYKIKTKYDFKSFTSISSSIKYFEFSNTIKDIFTKSNKSLSIQYLVNEKSSFPVKGISNEENTFLLFKVTSNKSNNIEVRFVKDSKNDKDINIEVWTNNILYKTIQLNELAITQIYHDEIFGKPQFSEDLSKLIFLAEQDEKKSIKNYYSIPDDEKFNEEFEKSLSKYEYKQDFGELLTGKCEPKVFILDLNKMTIFNLKFNNIGNNYISHPIFDEKSEGILFTAYDFPYFKLGLVYCMKRKSDIYYIKNPILEGVPKKVIKDEEKLEKNFGNDFTSAIKLTQNEYSNFLQKFSSDFNYLIYFSNEKATPHNNGLRLNLINWKNDPTTSSVLINKITKCNDYFNGIYMDEASIQKSDFIDNEFFAFTTTFKNKSKSLIYHIKSNIIFDLNLLFKDNSVFIVKVLGYSLIVSVEDGNKIPELFFINLNTNYISKLIYSTDKKNLITLENNNYYYNGIFIDENEDIIQITDSKDNFKSIKSNFCVNDTDRQALKYLEDVIESTVIEDQFINGIYGHVIYSTMSKNPYLDNNIKKPVLYYIHG